MKCFNLDWTVVFRWLEIWEKLSVPARRHYLSATVTTMTPVSAAGYGADLALVLESGLAKHTADDRLKPSPASTPFWRLMRHLRQFPLFEGRFSPERLDEYVRKHYTQEESRLIRNEWREPAWDSEEWPRSFLKHDEAQHWALERLTYSESRDPRQLNWGWKAAQASRGKTTWFPDSETGNAARCLVKAALDSSAPLPLASLPGRLPAGLRPFCPAAFKACLRFMLLYPALRPDTCEVVISICPIVVHLRNRPPVQTPRPGPAPDLVSPAFLMEDMTRVLGVAAMGECRLTRHPYRLQLFKVVEQRLADDFPPLPPWLVTQERSEQRLWEALTALEAFKLAKETTRPSGGRQLVPTAKGRKWLRQKPANRLHALLLEFRRRVDEPDEDVTLLPDAVRFERRTGALFNPLPWLESIWREAAIEEVFPLGDFLDYHARVNHPLTSPLIAERRRPELVSHERRGFHQLNRLNIEEFTRDLLEMFFFQRLVPLGCVETGRDRNDELRFRLSSAGRCLFGLSEAVAYGQPTAEGRIVVQPNFEIIFLQPNLGAEIDFAPFAERCGKEVGAVFRLTRRQALRAAAEGFTADAALATLEKHISKPLPANVAAELRAWFGACRTVTTRRVLLVETDDAETALHVQKLLGDQCAKLGETLLEWHGSRLAPKLRRKLADRGIFIRS